MDEFYHAIDSLFVLTEYITVILPATQHDVLYRLFRVFPAEMY
jgi:hypothetical protein